MAERRVQEGSQGGSDVARKEDIREETSGENQVRDHQVVIDVQRPVTDVNSDEHDVQRPVTYLDSDVDSDGHRGSSRHRLVDRPRTAKEVVVKILTGAFKGVDGPKEMPRSKLADEPKVTESRRQQGRQDKLLRDTAGTTRRMMGLGSDWVKGQIMGQRLLRTPGKYWTNLWKRALN